MYVVLSFSDCNVGSCRRDPGVSMGPAVPNKAFGGGGGAAMQAHPRRNATQEFGFAVLNEENCCLSSEISGLSQRVCDCLLWGRVFMG